MATLVSETERRLPDHEALARWIVEQGLQGNTAEVVIEGFCTRLSADGIQIQRSLCATRVLHPLYKGFGLIWRRATGRVEEET